MKDEIKEILEALKPQDKEFAEAGIKEYPLVLSVKEQKILLDYIINLQEKVNQYENPDDMTLMFIWCDEKAKDKIKQLQDRNIELVLERDRLKEELQQEKKDFKEANDYCFELKDYKSRCEKSLKALHNSKEYKVMKELESNKNMSILIKLDKLLGGDDNG